MKNENLAKEIQKILKIEIPIDYDFNEVELRLVEFHKSEHNRWKELCDMLNNTLNDFKQRLADCKSKNSRV